MASEPGPRAVPGLDTFFVVQMLIGVVVPMAIVFGVVALPIVLIAALFIKKLALLFTQHIGPPLMNQSIAAERGRGLRIVGWLFVASVGALIAIAELFTDVRQAAIGIFLLVVLAVLVWLRPSMVVVPLLCIAAAGGSGMLLIVVPVVIMLARRDQRLWIGIRRSFGRTAMTLLYAFVGFLTVLLFANASAGSSRGSASSTTTPSSPTEDGSLFDRLSNWLRREGSADTSTPSRLVQVPRRDVVNPPPESNPWLLWLAIAAGVALLVAIAFWIRRRRGRRQSQVGLHSSGAALTLARLEAIGAAVGRRRARNEGALTFASELATYTGDNRLDTAGPLVSGDVYGSKNVEPQLVASQLADVEASPPPPPPSPPLKERVASRVRAVPVSRRGVAVSVASLVGFGALVWFVAPNLGDLRSQDGRELAYVEQADAPEQWHALMGAPAAELIGWETCASGYEDGALGWVKAGLMHRSEPLGASLETFAGHVDSLNGSLSMGTDSMTATISVNLDGASPSFGDEPWRINNWATVPVSPLLTVQDVLSLTLVVDPIRSDYVDRNGDFFARYESLAPAWDDVYGDDVPVSPVTLDRTDLMRVVDIWTDDTGVPVRVRMIADGLNAEWIEWRRIDVSGDARLKRPSCEPERPWANDDWIGAESWTSSRSAPLLVEFDDAGNPYDAFSWAEEVVTTEPGGAIDGPIEILSVGGLTSLLPESEDDVDREYADDEASFDVQWNAGAEVTLIRAGGWPVGTRIDAVGESVEAWDEFEPFFVYESFVTVVASSTFPEIGSDALDALIDPLWDGTTHVSMSIDTASGSELSIFTQSDAAAIVAGRNASGEIVSILVWADWHEWRLLGVEGTPPPSVTAREAELHDCISGERDVDPAGRCAWSDDD